jgi:hypothetical protein
MRARHQMKNGGAARSNRRGKPRRGPGRPPAARRGAADPKLAARRKREAERQRAKKAAVKQAEASGKPGNGAAATVDPNRPPEITAAKLWKHAARLSPKDPPRSIVAEFGIGEAQAREAFSKATLPPGLNSTAIERFLDVRAAT